MGKGLIPADPETWKVRRRVIAPAFHKVRNKSCKYLTVLRVSICILITAFHHTYSDFIGLVGAHGWTFRILQHSLG
jgi:hypothetical protein